MSKLLERHKLSKLTAEEIDTLNNIISVKTIEFIALKKQSFKNKTPGPDHLRRILLNI